MISIATKPTPWEITQAVETLRAAGWTFVVPSNIRYYSVHETAAALRVNPKWVKEHLDDFPNAMRLPGGQLRIPFSAIQSFASNHRAK